MAANDPIAYVHEYYATIFPRLLQGHSITRLGWASGTYLVIDTDGVLKQKVGSNPLAEWTTTASADQLTKDWYIYA